MASTHSSPLPRKFLWVVGGPTASGKTRLSIAIARHFQTVILSADSRQFYREMRIGNARPSAEELSQAPHYFIADRSITQPLSAGQYAQEATLLMEELFQQHDHLVVVGGSGLYIQALIEGMDEFPPITEQARAQVAALHAQGLPALQETLLQLDPAYYHTVDLQNPARLLRALEVIYTSGRPYSSFRSGQRKDNPYTPVYLQPAWPRSSLYERIDQRVLQMVEEGLEAEALSLQAYRHLSSMQTVGYQEWIPFFEGQTARDEVIESIQQHSRQYAKRQLTWNRRSGNWKHVPYGAFEAALPYIQCCLAQGLSLQPITPFAPPPSWLSPREQVESLGLTTSDGHIHSAMQVVKSKDWLLLQHIQSDDPADTPSQLLLQEVLLRATSPIFVHPVLSGIPPTLLAAHAFQPCAVLPKKAPPSVDTDGWLYLLL
ncbi:MAG: tRNA (adenosine(37)-N6)-dimethylallyltransferase MiaA [Saprospiraceae bacterium]